MKKILFLMMLLTSICGCRNVFQYGIRLLPDYGRWKYDVGWTTVTIPDSNVTVILHYISRGRLFADVYEGYAIVNGHLMGLKKCGEDFRICSPWENFENINQSNMSGHTECNIYMESINNPCSFHHVDGMSKGSPPKMLTTEDGINMADILSQNKESMLLFNNTIFQVNFKFNTLKLRHVNISSPDKLVKFPLRGILCSMATQKTQKGEEILLAILKEDIVWGRGRYALIVFDDTFRCLCFYIFPPQVSSIPYFVRDRQGNLFIVPLNAMFSINEGIFQVVMPRRPSLESGRL